VHGSDFEYDVLVVTCYSTFVWTCHMAFVGLVISSLLDL
jgi:hypothetical protein